MKITIEDLRKEYTEVTGKEWSLRWNKQTLIKKITDARILKAGYAEKNRLENKPLSSGDIKPEFETLAGELKTNEHISDEGVSSESFPTEIRGGPREGAGRPIGQTDERSRVQRLLELEVPDLAVKKLIQGLNLILAKFTPLPFTSEQVESIALGVTLPLYYWFPSIEGRMGPWTLHFQALEYIGVPIGQRAITISNKQKEKQNAEKSNTPETSISNGQKTGAVVNAVLDTSSEKSGVLLDLVLARNTGEHDIYLVDAIDLSNLLCGPDDFIEIPTKRTPGVRFVTIRFHVNGK